LRLGIQKRLAADILKCGLSRVRFDIGRLEDIEDAITREDVRQLVEEGAIYAAPAHGNARRREVRKRGPGRRKGSRYSVLSRKERWVMKVRAQRRYLRSLRRAGLLAEGAYRGVYLQVKAGRFKSVAELKSYLKSTGLLIAGV